MNFTYINKIYDSHIKHISIFEFNYKTIKDIEVIYEILNELKKISKKEYEDSYNYVVFTFIAIERNEMVLEMKKFDEELYKKIEILIKM